MAINTRQKRFSIMTLGRVTIPVVLTPDGTIAQADMQALLWGYSGILWTAAIEIYETVTLWTPVELSKSVSAGIDTGKELWMPIETSVTKAASLLGG